MRTIIAGPRDFTEAACLLTALRESQFVITEVVSGGAPGIDTLGEQWAEKQGIPVKRFPADWDKFGRAAGPIRNKQMAEYAEQLLACWDGQSRGTCDMIRTARKQGLNVYVYIPPVWREP